MIDVWRVNQQTTGMAADKIGDTDIGRIFSGHNAGPGRGTHRTGRVGIRKLNTIRQ